MEKIKKIELINVSGGGDCGLNNYGFMRDVLGHFDFIFEQGIYLVKGECATGGWALSTIMAGKNDIDTGEVLINGKSVLSSQFKYHSCYVGEDAGLKKHLGLKRKTVKEQIEFGIKNHLSFSNSIPDIKRKFGLSEERFNRPIKYFSGERWKASMAIGYALGKTIYCFPWLNTWYLTHLEEHLKLCLNSLLEIGAIIIIPTTEEEVIKRVVSDYTIIQSQR